MEKHSVGTFWDGFKGVFCNIERYNRKALWLVALSLYAATIIALVFNKIDPHVSLESGVQVLFSVLTTLGVVVWCGNLFVLAFAYLSDRSAEHAGKVVKKFVVATFLFFLVLAAGGVLSFTFEQAGISTTIN